MERHSLDSRGSGGDDRIEFVREKPRHEPTITDEAYNQALKKLEKPQCPSGLEPLLDLGFIRVNQDIQNRKKGVERFNVHEYTGEHIFHAEEKRNYCCCCCLGKRCFTVKVKDHDDNVILVIHRHCNCGCFLCCGGCCNRITVKTGDGIYIGEIVQKWSPVRKIFWAYDTNHTKILSIKGPCLCYCKCCRKAPRDVKFKIKCSLTDEIIGTIDKSSVELDEFSSRKTRVDFADTFGVSFPYHLNIYKKALILALVFYVEIVHFEEKK